MNRKILGIFSAFLGLPLLTIGGKASASEVFFSPKGGGREQIIHRIERSTSTIDIAMFAFTDKDIAQRLVDANKRGVKVRLILDEGQSKEAPLKDNYASKNGIAVRTWHGRSKQGQMHEKFCIFDGREVMTGSYDWTYSAEYHNYENILFVDDLAVVQAFTHEFESLWTNSELRAQDSEN